MQYSCWVCRTSMVQQSCQYPLKTVWEQFISHFRMEEDYVLQNCQNCDCQAKMQNKKTVPKSISLEKLENLCDHIKTLYANIDILNELFPSYFCQNEIVRNQSIVTHKKYKILMISIYVTYR